MQTFNFNQLGERLKERLAKPNAQFFEITPVLATLRKKEIVLLLNSLLQSLDDSKLASFNVYLYEQPNINILLRFPSGTVKSQTLLASEVDAVIMNLSDQPVSIPSFHCQINQCDLAQKPPDLVPEDDLILQPFKPHNLIALSSILDFHAASTDAPLLVVHSDKKFWSTWAFGRDSLQAERLISTDLRSSRMHIAFALLRAMQVKNIDSELKTLILSNHASNVRWEAVKYYYEINESEAKKILVHLASNDAALAVQRAAQKTLASMKER